MERGSGSSAQTGFLFEYWHGIPIMRMSNLFRNLCLNNPAINKTLRILIPVAVCITAIKWLLADRLELYSDEVFYWLASQFPALAYSDLPFVTALLAGSGAFLFGNTAFAVRSLFLVASLLIPCLIYWLALPLQGRQRALQATVLSFCLPMLAIMGLLAVPDVAIIVFGLLFIGCLERATRLQHGGYWIATGLSAALGLCTHYRFSLYIIAAFLFLVICRKHWHHWRSPWCWLGALIAACGLIPAASFNLGNELSGLDYHLIERHAWQFQAEGLLHIVMQAIVVTPLMYAVLAYTLCYLLKKARAGDDRALLLALFSICNIAIYLLLAPWADTRRTSLHWPLSGYLPLLVVAPEVLHQLKNRVTEKYSPRLANVLVAAIPISGFLGTLLLLVGLGSQGFNQALQGVVGQGVLSNKMAGWQPLTAHVQQLIADRVINEQSLIVTDNYYTAAQISFALGTDQVFTTDTNKVERDGRSTQLRIWNKDIAGLQHHSGANAVFITEDSTLDILEKAVVMSTACGLFSQIELHDQLFLYGGEKIFSFYRATGLQAADSDTSAANCPMPTLAWLDAPLRDEGISGVYNVSGWAINVAGIAAINVLLDGQTVASVRRTINRPDVVQRQDADDDPGSPLLGFAADIDTRQLRNGRYQLGLEIVSGHGERQLAGARHVSIHN